MDRAELRTCLCATGGAEAHGGFVFLCDPNWTTAERAEAQSQMAAARTQTEVVAEGWLCVRTGGSSGGVRFARHDERTVTAAIRGFCAHFGLARVNAVNVLPAF